MADYPEIVAARGYYQALLVGHERNSHNNPKYDLQSLRERDKYDLRRPWATRLEFFTHPTQFA